MNAFSRVTRQVTLGTLCSLALAVFSVPYVAFAQQYPTVRLHPSQWEQLQT